MKASTAIYELRPKGYGHTVRHAYQDDLSPISGAASLAAGAAPLCGQPRLEMPHGYTFLAGSAPFCSTCVSMLAPHSAAPVSVRAATAALAALYLSAVAALGAVAGTSYWAITKVF